MMKAAAEDPVGDLGGDGATVGGYADATRRAAVFDRSHRTRLVVRGRAPGAMLKGILTGTIPPGPEWVADGIVGGRARYSAVLTPKGKMITDVWVTLQGDEAEDGFLLDVPAAGREGLLAHLGRFLPPRMARVDDASGRTATISVVGPDAAPALSRLALGLRVEAEELAALEEGEWRATAAAPADGSPRVGDALVVMRTLDVWPEAFDVTGPAGAVSALARALVAAGVPPAEEEVWSTLRVEAGRPAFGADMDERTIPVEAGIHERAIDYEKGCYTGQEVIVRIRDRGHVNRSLRRVHLGDVPVPASGAELFVRGRPERSAGRVTSAVWSPRFGEVVALAYVRRGVEEDEALEVTAPPVGREDRA